MTRDDTGATLFETTLAVAGDGLGDVETTTDGPILFEIVSLDDLVDEGVDDDTISILERVEAEGALVVVVIPPQEHTYRYRVTADEPLVLRAELNARAGNIPGGTGVAATWGGPFENLADFIEHGLPGVNGVAVERSLNAATASREIGLVDAADSSSTAQTPASRLCGIFGIEWAAVLAVGLFMRLGRPRG